MQSSFFEQPILNSPYALPSQHWELDASGQPTNVVIGSRRRSSLVSPIPKARKAKGNAQAGLFASSSEALGLEQEYNPTETINGIRSAVESWRNLPESQWQVTPETARLLRHWRSHEFANQRPFFCQIEAVETVIWLTEVAPKRSAQGGRFWAHIEAANAASNPELLRLALKLATGAGKTTVMAMLIAWQTVNAVRHPDGKRFSKGFLIVAPGITIKDRLRVLLPNDPDSYYRSREIVPEDMLADLGRAKIVITNYHAFKRKSELGLNKVQQAALATTDKPETDGALIRRVAGELMGMKNIVVLNDEAHHCYRERPLSDEERRELKGDALDEAKEANEAARLWISGLEAVKRVLGIQMVYDLSATPFFLKGSGYREGSLFGWTMSDFSLMDAIECGIVKLPRVPIIDNVPGGDTPRFRNLWEHVGKKLPKKGRANAKELDPQKLPPELLSAIDALYGHYVETWELWQEAKIGVDPVFIVVCNNTSTSKLVHDYIAGYIRENEDGSSQLVAGRCPLFRNFDPDGVALPKMRTLLIDSGQIESGEAISKDFREAAGPEIERFRQEKAQREGAGAADSVSDEEVLREVMNTVGKPGRLGEGIRCVVSVSMLTEGWDANTVTHVLGVRAFGTQLLCEQVIGRALRRQSYAAQTDGLFKVEYADVLGIPFDFTAEPVKAKPLPPDNMTWVHAVSPDRDALEIRFPRVEGYRTELPQDRLTAAFTDNHTLELTPELVGPSITRNQGIVGEGVDLTLKHLGEMRRSSIVFELTSRILQRYFADPGEPVKMHLFPQLKSVVRQWIEQHLRCLGDTFEAQVLYHEITDMAAERVMGAITLGSSEAGAVKAILDAYNRTGSTRFVGFNTSRPVYATDARKCHVSHCVLDSDWEAEFCRVAEAHPRVLGYVKNHSMGFEVPYRSGSEVRRYRPDFIVQIDDGHGPDDPLNLIVETKGYRGEDAKDKAATMETYWVPGVNNLGSYGRWAFAEFRNVWTINAEFEGMVEGWFETMVRGKAA